MATAGRSDTIDFWRGFVLVTIFVNHIPGNVLEHFTHRNIGFSDGAEAFVFISGVAVALAFYDRLPERGAFSVVWRCLGRAAYLYRIHLVLTFSAIGLFAIGHVLTEAPNMVETLGRGAVFHDTARGITGILLLGHQLGYFDILPLYVVLMLWAPFALLLVRANPVLALVLAAFVYGMARQAGWAMPSWPEPGTWYFNPFAWQLLFTIGILVGVLWRDGRVPHNPVAFAFSLWILAFGLVVATNGFGFVPNLSETLRHAVDASDKSNLALGRLVHFLALAYVLSQIPLGARLTRTAVGGELVRLGRYGLPVFAVGSFLSAMGEVIMTLSEVRYSASPALIGMVFTVLGVGVLFCLARYLEWTKSASGRVSGIVFALRSALWSPLPRS